jgi:hypothetical protein
VRVLLILAFCVVYFASIAEAETKIRKFKAEINRLDTISLSFYCDHSISAGPRTCDVTAVTSLPGGQVIFSITREYIGSGGVSDSAHIAPYEPLPPAERHLSFWVDDSKIAEGDLKRGFGENMRVLSRDFLRDMRSAKFASVEVLQQGRITRFRLPIHVENIKCLDDGDLPSDDEFDSMVDSYGGTASCAFYEHLGQLRVTSLADASRLLHAEIDFFKAQHAEAEKAMRESSGPEGLKRFLEKYGDRK